jgi:hypothetical protein
MVAGIAVLCMLLNWLLLAHNEPRAANVVLAFQLTVVAYSGVELFKSHRAIRRLERKTLAEIKQSHDELCGCGTFPHDHPEA